MTDPGSLSSALSKTIGRMLRPLVKLLMLKGITYIGLLSLLKKTFVEVAHRESEFQLDNKRQTDSRISLLTGVHRKEVKRIREELDDPLTEEEIKASISAQMMAKWLGHPEFTDENGYPRSLHRYHKSELSFADLVFDISRDKHPRSILDDWLNQKLVEIDKNDKIHLIQDGYTASENIEEKLFFAGKNISEHLETVTHNLTSTNSPRFDRAVYYHHLSEESVNQIESLAKEELLKAMKSINKKAAELQLQDATQDIETRHSVHIGGYYAQSFAADDSDE